MASGEFQGVSRRHVLGVMGGGLATAAVAIAAGPGAAALAATSAGGSTDADAATAAPELLGTPILSANIRDAAAVSVWPLTGRPVAYAVSNGLPMAFTAFDAVTGTTLTSHTITANGSSYDLSIAPDDRVYISGFGDGHLYRYTPFGDEMTDLGIAVAGEDVMLRTTVVPKPRPRGHQHPRGERWRKRTAYTIFGGTYAHGHLFSWDPATSQFTDHGQFVSGETYLRSLTYGGGRMYIGLGTTPRIFSVNPVTLAQEEIALPEPYASSDTFVYDLIYRSGFLFAFMSPSLAWLIYDIRTATWITEVPNNPQSGISPPIGPEVYFANGDTGDLFEFNLHTKKVSTTSFADGTLDGNTTRTVGTAVLGGRDFPGRSVVGIGLNGLMWQWNPKTGTVRRVNASPAGSAAQIHTMGQGPDGNIYIGGFWTSGFIGRYDVADSTLEQLPGPYQFEGIAQFGGKLYLGVYDNPGSILEYDPAAGAWDYGTNPKTVFSYAGYEQERPYAFAPAGSSLAIGTIAEKGQYNGSLAFFDPATGDTEVNVGVVENQGVCALASNGNILIGGTSIVPSGVPPIEPTAKLFGWDINAGTKLWEAGRQHRFRRTTTGSCSSARTARCGA